MGRYIIQRLALAVLCLFAVSVVVFLLSRATGNPLVLIMPPDAPEEQWEKMREIYGLDEPLITQYRIFIFNVLTGDFGTSIRYERPAMQLVLERFPATLQLTTIALSISVLIAIPVGILSAVYRGSIVDQLGKIIAMAGQSMPIFWVGIMLIWLFAVILNILPACGRGGPAHWILPAVTLGWYMNAALLRVSRSSALDVFDTEYIKLVRAKGVPKHIIIWKHLLKNAAIPIITMAGLQFAELLMGAVVTETVFAWPGLGRLSVNAVFARDYPLVQAAVLFMSFVFIMVNLIVDILYAYLDPRIKYR